MKKILFFLLFGVSSVVWLQAQTTILDFQAPATSTTFQYFGSSLEPTLNQVVPNPNVSGINTSSMVSKIIKPAGALTYAGAFSNPNPATAIVTNGSLIKVKVLMNHVGNLAVKLEESTSGQDVYIKIVQNTTINQWVELTFDTSLPSDEGLNQVPTGTFNKIVVFFDFNIAGGAADVTNYFDDVVVVAGTPPVTHPVNFSVDMNNYPTPFTTVNVSGTMNSWSGNANPLSDPDGDGVWTGTMMLANGTYEFKYSLDNWNAQENLTVGSPCTVTNGGFTNRSLTVAGTTTVPPTCFASCSSCGAANPVINFSVDMSTVTFPFTTVYVSGNMNGWAGTANPLSDPDGDGIWTGSISMPAGTYEFKFTTDDWTHQEQFAVGQPCTVTNFGFTNRALNVTTSATLPVYCFGACTNCALAVNPMVNFSVNMNNYTGPAYTQVYVSGTINSWSGNANPLSDADGDGIWTGSIPAPAGQHEFKITMDNWNLQEQFNGTEQCILTTSGFTNRVITVPAAGLTIPTFCFNSCYACGDEVLMTFRLGMGGVTPSPDGVWLAGGGNFGNPGGPFRMKDDDGDGVYELTVPRQPGFSSYFTFANGPCGDYSCKENIAGLPCANPANYNDRFLPAVNANVVYETCFGQCSNNVACTYPALTPSTTHTNVSCFGGTNGTINLSVSGGSTIYAYNWGGGVTTANRSNLAAGSYTVTITDAIANQTTTQTVVVTQPNLLRGNPTVSNVDCFGNATGAITLNTLGGTPNFTYAWSNGATTATNSGLILGTYTATVTDANSCTATVTRTVTQPTQPLSVSADLGYIDCYGGATGYISLDPNGGTAAYTYAWSGSTQTAFDIYDLPAGTYTATVTDYNNCTTTITETLIQPSAPLTLNAAVVNSSCGLANGSVTISATGGTSGYTFSWANGATTNANNNLVPGTYVVTATDWAGCTATMTSAIQTNSSAILAQATSTNIACFGENTGSVSLNPSGGNSPYSFAWSNGATDSNLSNLTAGTYTVTVTGANGCTNTSTSIVMQPTAALAVTLTSEDIACHGNQTGTAMVTASGGTSTYAYLWSNGSTNNSLTNVGAGTYSVVITDANNCTENVSTTITEPTELVCAVSVTAQTLHNTDNGTATATPAGGTASYTYAWSNGETTQTISGLTPGVYSVVVTDANSCTTMQSVTVAAFNCTFAPTISSTNSSCFGSNTGSSTVDLMGGTMPASYAWSNGASTASINSLGAGTFTVSVTDATNCEVVLTSTISQPTQLVTTAAATAISAFGIEDGTATVSATGGTMPYTYAWSNGATTQTISDLAAGTYSVVVTDANNCTISKSVTVAGVNCSFAPTIAGTNISCNGLNDGSASVSLIGGTQPITYLWSTGATTQSIDNLAADTYVVDVTDADNCPATLTFVVTEPVALSLTATSIGVSSFGAMDGTASAAANGGTGTINYAWSNGATSASISGLAAGTYTVSASDANGCEQSSTVILASVNCALTSTMTSSNVTCFGAMNGMAAVAVTGANDPLSFTWSNGATTASISNLAAGTFTYTFSDALGCPGTGSVTITEPTALAASIFATTSVQCANQTTGSATIAASGGTGTLTYLWSNGQTAATAQNLAAGTYSVVVSDANACSVSLSAIQIATSDTQGPALTAAPSLTVPLGTSGAVTLTASMLNINATDNCGSVTTTFNPKTFDCSMVGVHTVMVVATDGSGNSSTANVAVTIKDEIVPTLTCPANVVRCSQNTLVTFTSPVLVDNCATTFMQTSGLASGASFPVGITNQAYTVTDAGGNKATCSFTVDVRPALVLNSVLAEITCFGECDGEVLLTASGGTAPYAYNWGGTVTPTALCAGTYNVTVSDAAGCTSIQTYTMNQPGALGYSVEVVKNDIGNQGLGSITIAPIGGVAPFTATWKNANGTTVGTGLTINGLSMGTYVVNLVDANGCSTTGQGIIVTNTVANQEPTWMAGASISPNPTSGQLFVRFAEKPLQEVAIQVLDMRGSVVFASHSVSKQQIELDLSRLASGMYVVRLSDEKSAGLRKIIVE